MYATISPDALGIRGLSLSDAIALAHESGFAGLSFDSRAAARAVDEHGLAVVQEEFSRVDAIKLDVEGAEDLILDPFFRDAPASLYPSLFLIEDGRDQWQIDLPKLLEGKGYKLTRQTRLNLVFERA